MTTDTLRIATRKSPLAIAQAKWIKQRLEASHKGLIVELLGVMTQGDRLLEAPLAQIGGKGVFLKELEVELLQGRADLAVHSMKDVPTQLPDGLTLAVIAKREDPRDVWVSPRYPNVDALPKGAIIGTSSLRRTFQLRAMRPDSEVRPIRGNVGTRMKKLERGDFDGLVLASAGLVRLKNTSIVRHYFEPELMLPAAGQGAIGIECRAEDARVQQWIQTLDHQVTRACVLAERAVVDTLGGGCHTPIAAYACVREDGQLWVRAKVGRLDGACSVSAEASGSMEESVKLGTGIAQHLLDKGAGPLIQNV